MRGALVIGLILVLAACAQNAPTCTAPYIAHGSTCCLDHDSNGVCDTDENSSLGAPEGLDCSLCPPKFVTDTKEVIVYRYVCMDGTVVDEESGCGERIVSNADQFTVNQDQDPEMVEAFDSRPACRGDDRAAELHIVSVRAAQNITIQVKGTPGGGYEDAFMLSGKDRVLDDAYVYIGFCDGCEDVTDIQLPANTAYVVRARIQYADDSAYTRDRLLDPTPEGEYGQQQC